MGRSNTLADVFKFIDTHGNDPDVCWEWTGHKGGRDGRGYFTVEGRRELAYRVVWRIFKGEIPEGKIIRHSCDNPLCCNIVHLDLGTQSDNEGDKYERDRAGYTHEVLKRIRRYDKLGMTYRGIADQINKELDLKIHFSGVGKVLRGERRQKK